MQRVIDPGRRTPTLSTVVQLPEPVGRELLGLPNPEAFVNRVVVKALAESQAQVLPRR